MIIEMAPFFWILIAFLAGSIPFSVWTGKIFLGKNIRDYGDGNPGATNLIRAGSPVLGIITLLLDVSKAALPVGICYFRLGFRGPGMVGIALAPVLGHMFSPFLKFRGGKALAATLGIWIGLTTWQASLPAVLGAVLGILILSSAGWAVMLAMVLILAALLIWLPEALLLWVWAGQVILLAWSHRQDLKDPPRFHDRVRSLVSRSGK